MEYKQTGRFDWLTCDSRLASRQTLIKLIMTFYGDRGLPSYLHPQTAHSHDDFILFEFIFISIDLSYKIQGEAQLHFTL